MAPFFSMEPLECVQLAPVNFPSPLVEAQGRGQGKPPCGQVGLRLSLDPFDRRAFAVFRERGELFVTQEVVP